MDNVDGKQPAIISRRHLLKTAAATATLAAPRVARSTEAQTIRYVDLSLLDPVVNTATLTRDHGYLVFDTLYGTDEAFAVHPQMLEGDDVSADGRLWRMRLREGLWFHDGQPVLARDVVASLRRWGARDGFGQTLMDATDSMTATSDHDKEIRMRRPFPLLREAIAKIPPNMCAIMPERLALTDPNVAVKEIVGSGPFRFEAAERVAGALNVYSRFERYVPRPEGNPSVTSGPKIARVDRVEWHTIPDAATAAAALQAGEVDWLQAPSPDLLPLLRQAARLRVAITDRQGLAPMLRFNCIQPPFDNPALRRAVLGAVDQTEFMEAYSSDRSTWHVKLGAFCPDTPMATDAGMADLFGPTDIARARAAVAASGYRGERVVLLAATDHPISGPAAELTNDLMVRIGLTVDMQSMDLGTMNVRRNNRGPVEKGGWSVFSSTFAGVDLLDPAVDVLMRGNGAAGFYGWPTSERMEGLRASWIGTPDEATRRHIAIEMQLQSWQEATFVPLGQVFQPEAMRASITGVLPGFAKSTM